MGVTGIAPGISGLGERVRQCVVRPLKLDSKVSFSRLACLTWAGEFEEVKPRPMTESFLGPDFSLSFSLSTLAFERETFKGLVRSFAAELLVGERYVALFSSEGVRRPKASNGEGSGVGDGFALGIGECDGDGVTLTVRLSLTDDDDPVLVRLFLPSEPAA